jgi:nucleotide-binding universal stress UspA family protein
MSSQVDAVLSADTAAPWRAHAEHTTFVTFVRSIPRRRFVLHAVCVTIHGMPATSRGYESVICAIDFSDDARAALQYAHRVTMHAEGQLSVVFVNDPLLAKAGAMNFDARTLADATERDLKRFVNQALGAEGARRVRTVVAVGEPADEIRKAAKRLNADLIAVGTRGTGGGKAFFGSTTSRLLRTTERPVLAASAAGSKRLKSPSGQWPTNVLAAVKLDRRADDDARAAAAVANWFGTPLTLVTVVPPLQLPASLMHRGGVGDRSRLADAKKKLTALGKRLDGITVQTRAAVGDAAEQISMTAIDCGADLIVLILRAEKGMLGARQGTVTYRVLSTSQLPVLALIVPPKRNSRA